MRFVVRPAMGGGLMFGVAAVVPWSLAAEQPLVAVTLNRDSATKPLLVVEAVPASSVPAGQIILRRFAARVVDCIIIGTGAVLVGFLVGAGAVGLLFGAAVELVKDLGLYGCRSPGKALLGLVVTDAETGSTEVQPWKRVARNALGPCTLSLVGRLGMAAGGLALVLGLVNDGWALFSTRRQTLMDQVAGVVVYHK